MYKSSNGISMTYKYDFNWFIYNLSDKTHNLDKCSKKATIEIEQISKQLYLNG